jgi:hypothetical protein
MNILVETQINSAKIAPLDEQFFLIFRGVAAPW